MSDNIKKFKEELRKSTKCMFLSCDGEVAADISLKVSNAIKLIEEFERRLSDQDRVLRATVPERHKSASSPVGCVQNYIGELEQQLSNSISKDELRGLVEDIDNLDTTCATGRLGADSVLSAVKIRLNKLIEGDNNG